jgi:RNA polymerase-binding transcription factor DksA
MKATLQNKLVKRFEFLHYNPDLKMYAYHMFGMECGDGWFKLLWDLCEKIEKELKTKEHTEFSVHQIKEKFAGLRFYVQGGNDKIHDLISEAEDNSFKVCEQCGEKSQKKRIDIHGWYCSLCKKCEKKERNAYNKRHKKAS